MKQKFGKLMAMLGPGLLWAGAAVGVSHLVQSTKAGALFGFSMIAIVLIANLLKYPFFEFAPRYAASTGNTLLVGYNKLGKWAFYLYLVLTVATMFIIQGIVTIVTSGILIYLFGINISPQLLSLFVLLVSLLILAFGHYKTLDNMIKWLIILLTVATVFAVLVALGKTVGSASAGDIFKTLNPFTFIKDEKAWLFLIPLVGWMPSAIDISVWSSIWTKEKHKENPEATTLKNSLFDFNVGYIGTVIIALGFLSLGALMMYTSHIEFGSMSAGKFAGTIISMYTESIGGWSKYLVGFAALATMFSTTITCLDAYSRVCSRSQSLIQNGHDDDESSYLFWAAITVIGGVAVLLIGKELGKSMGAMVTFATSVSFITAPILGYLNLKVVTSSDVPAEAQPGIVLKTLSWIGIIFLTIFSLIYIVRMFM